MKWFRPITITILTLAVIVGFFGGVIDPQAFFGFATGLVVYWYKERDSEKRDKNG